MYYLTIFLVSFAACNAQLGFPNFIPQLPQNFGNPSTFVSAIFPWLNNNNPNNQIPVQMPQNLVRATYNGGPSNPISINSFLPWRPGQGPISGPITQGIQQAMQIPMQGLQTFANLFRPNLNNLQNFPLLAPLANLGQQFGGQQGFSEVKEENNPNLGVVDFSNIPISPPVPGQVNTPGSNLIGSTGLKAAAVPVEAPHDEVEEN